MEYSRYYLFLAAILIAGLSIQIVPAYLNSLPPSGEHHIGVNTSMRNGTCVYTWLGGWDYDSFVGDVKVGDTSVGHPEPYEEIYRNESCDVEVSIWMKPAGEYITLRRR